MAGISEIIKIFTPSETKKFVEYIKIHSSKKELKIIELYNLLCQGNLSVTEIIIKLYGDKKRNAYHSLTKRLTKLLIDYISTTELSKEDQVLSQYNRYLLTGKKLLKHRVYETGFKLLKKAENIAIEKDNYTLLNEIYLILIEFNHYNKGRLLQDTIGKFEKNWVLYNQEIKLQLAYAQVKDEISVFISNGIAYNLGDIIKNSYQKFQISEDTQYSFKTLYQLAQIYYSHATILRDYYSIESYIINQYKTIFRKNINKSGSLFYQVKLLYLLASLYFQRKEFDSSRKYCDKLIEITEQSKSYSIKVVEFKTIILSSLVGHYTGGNDNAIQLMETYLMTLKVEDIKNRLDAQSVLMLYYFHKKDYALVKHALNYFQQTDSYYIELMGKEWVMRKNLIEILLLIELDQMDDADRKMKSFFRVNKAYLKQHKRVKAFLLLVKKIYSNPASINDALFKQRIQTTLNRKPRLRENIFVLSFFAWLKAKIEARDLYKLTLEMVNSLKKEEKPTFIA